MNVEKGYVDEPVEAGIDLRAEIARLKKEKNAVVLAHYYQRPEVQEIADFVGDSLALAQIAARSEADVIVMCGVQFMGETAKLLCMDRKVIVPDMSAGCSLADSCPAQEFEAFVKAHPGHTVISYVNTTAAVKAVTDIVVTSSNAKKIVDSLPQQEKIIFGPDRNLGSYINRLTGRQMLLWDGACQVHEQFTLENINKLKVQNPGAPVLVHPECCPQVQQVADVVGSTKALLDYARKSDSDTIIVATESGILHEMRKACPDKTFLPVPTADGCGKCIECADMKLITLEKLYNSLKYELPLVEVDPDLAARAVKPIERMLEMSK